MILISVIVPVYKVEHYLKECVDSLINQTYKNLEIILVDDGSPDSCPALCDSYAAKDNRVHVIHKTNGGLSDARNTGIKTATGDYLLFVDSDDKLADCDVIKNLVEFLEHTASTVTYCPGVSRIFDQSFAVFKDFKCSSLLHTPDELCRFGIKNKCIFAAWSFVVRRDYILEHSLYFIKGLVHEDMEWIPRVLFASPDLRINIYTRPFYIYRYNPQSITSTFNQTRFDSHLSILNILKKELSTPAKHNFMRVWFNMNLYALVIYFEPDCLSNTPFYKSSFPTVKSLFKSNYSDLTFRNRVLYSMISTNPRLFFILRNMIKKCFSK